EFRDGPVNGLLCSNGGERSGTESSPSPPLEERAGERRPCASAIESGAWDIKHFVRLLVTSSAYRQNSRVTPRKYDFDPENRFLARGPRFRLDAEVIRDNALFLSGLLIEKRGGRGVRPYQPEGIWEAVGYTASNTAKFSQDHGEALYRRSLY